MNTIEKESSKRRMGNIPSRRSWVLTRMDRVARRLLDVSISSLGMFILSPLFVLIAILIKKDSSGPVFYWGRRVGREGKEFLILKFRTMYDHGDSYNGPKITAQGDKRITPIGEWLRSTKLNELPQLWNVLKGEMSLVGPRPEDPEIVNNWSEDHRQTLLSVRPGITSPASIIYRDEETLLSDTNLMDDYLRGILPTKLRLDQLYVRNRTVISDIDIIFWTFIVLIPQARKQKIPETRLYWGPLSIFVAHDLQWFLIDFLVVLGSVSAIGVIWRTITPLNIGWQVAPLIALAMASVFSLSNAIGGLNRVVWAKASPLDALDLILTSAISTVLLWAADRFLFTGLSVPVGLFVFGGLVAYLGFVAVRYRERILTGLASRWLRLRQGGSTIGERVLIVGAGELSQFATWLVRKGKLAQAFNLVGMVDDDPRKQGMRLDGVKVLGTTSDIQDIVKKQDVGVVLFAISNIDPQERFRIMSMCQKLRVRIVMISNVIEMMRNEFRGDALSARKTLDSNEFSPDSMNIWLHELENLLRAGDYEAIQKQIEHLRSELFKEDQS